MKNLKKDQGKIQYGLLERCYLEGTAKVLMFGAKKYSPGGWKLGMEDAENSKKRFWEAAQRHMWAYHEGEENDPETGLSHLYHASCEIMFMAYYDEKQVKKPTNFTEPKEREAKSANIPS